MSVTILEPTDGHDVDRDSQELLERFLQVHEFEQGTARLELVKEVDVALRGVVAPRDRAEQRSSQTMVLAGRDR